MEPYFIVYRPEGWGQKPFVESGNPYALGLRNNEPRKLFLGKKCYVLRFELLPISYRLKPVEFTTSYKSRDIVTKDSLLGSIHLSINPTTGARLLAIQSDTTFHEVDITFIENIGLNFLVSYAIANIRYVTDKEGVRQTQEQLKALGACCGADLKNTKLANALVIYYHKQ